MLGQLPSYSGCYAVNDDEIDLQDSLFAHCPCSQFNPTGNSLDAVLSSILFSSIFFASTFLSSTFFVVYIFVVYIVFIDTVLN